MRPILIEPRTISINYRRRFDYDQQIRRQTQRGYEMPDWLLWVVIIIIFIELKRISDSLKQTRDTIEYMWRSRHHYMEIDDDEEDDD